MTLHEMLRDSGFAQEGRLWLESTEFRLAYAKLEKHFDDAEDLREELEVARDALLRAERDTEKAIEWSEECEREADALRKENASLRDQLEAAKGAAQ